MVYKYKTKQGHVVPSQAGEDIMHFSICAFLGLWFVAQLYWSFYTQQSAEPSADDLLWLPGYAFIGYFLYKLLYTLRKQLKFNAIAIIPLIATLSLTYIILIILSVSSLLADEEQELSVTILTIVYPILDAILLIPALLIFCIKRNLLISQNKSSAEMQEDISWILLSLAMILFVIADSGFAYVAALDLKSIQNDVWIWNIFYNCGYILLAGALTAYSTFFAVTKTLVKK